MPETATVPPEAREILSQAWTARVATVSPSGNPNVAPMWFHFDGERLVLYTGENATVRNVRANGRMSVTVDLGSRFDEIRGVLLRGTANAHPYDDAPDAVLRAVEELERKYAGDLASPLYKEFQGDGPPASIYVELVPESARFWDFGKRIA